MSVRVGTTGVYVSTNGHEKAAQVIATHESVSAEGDVLQPPEGHVHVVIFALTAQHHIVRVDVPLRETAESIPDYTIDGKLVGYFEAI